MKYKIVIGALWIDGKKHKRGDIVDVENAAQYGVKLEAYIEPKRRRRRKKVVADES
jgi:hypothetical protein